MANRLIGIELGTESVRVAILRRDKGGVAVIALEEHPGGSVAEQVAAIAALPGITFGLGDRVVTALPAARTYLRTLHFPFKDRRKVEAAAPFELAAQLPVAMESCTTALLWHKAAATGSEVVAAAVPTDAIGNQLAPFEDAGIPLHILDLMPFALVAGLADRLGSAILVCVSDAETTVSQVELGRLRQHRLIPGTLAPANPLAVSQLVRECRALQQPGEGVRWPVYLAGAGATDELLDALCSGGVNATTLALTLGGRHIAPAFVPAVALALRAAPPGEVQSFNLRQGPFAYRGELRAVRRAAVLCGTLLLLTLLVLGAAAFLNYRDRARQAEALQRQMVQIYQAAFPGSPLTVDVALQMDSKLRELRQSVEALGVAGQPPPWRVLRALAELPAQVPIELEEFSCGSGEVRLAGTTDSFEAVNRIRDLLARSPLFGSVEVAESRKSLDGSRIDFRLRLPLAGKEGTP